MKKFALITALFFSSTVLAEEPKLYLVRGKILEVTVTATKPASNDEIAKGLIDDSCAKESVKFEVSEYVSGQGGNDVTFRKSLPAYNCVSSWPGARASDSIVMLSHWDNSNLFRGIVRLETIEGEPGLLSAISEFISIANIHGKVDTARLFQDLKQPIQRRISMTESADRLKRLQDMGVLTFAKSEVDINQGCIAGCYEDHLIPVYQVTYKKFIPLSKIREYGF